MTKKDNQFMDVENNTTEEDIDLTKLEEEDDDNDEEEAKATEEG